MVDLPKKSARVGLRILESVCPTADSAARLRVAVWYPTAVEPQPYIYGGPTSGVVARDAALLPTEGAYPLLVFSHGYGGSGLSAAYLAEAMAAQGWIVACPDHRDPQSAIRIGIGQLADYDWLALLRYAKQIGLAGVAERGRYLYRLDELRCVLNAMLASEVFGRWIDVQRMAVGGHSFGGFTALGLCGALADYHDVRLKAVLLLSSGSAASLYTTAELRSVRLPAMLFLGEREKGKQRGSQTMDVLSAKIYENLASPKYLLELREAGHFAFNNRFAEYRSTEQTGGTDEQFAVITRYALAFFDRYVVGRTQRGSVLEQRDPLITRFIQKTD